MKKGTKIITTAVALVLVLSFMVVGILAATSATAGISASISWTAEQGVAFTIDAWTWQSAEHYDENSKSFPEISPHKIEQIVVNTATTNQQASGISKSLNANFIDITDDGVNNPLELYYIYCIKTLRDGLEIHPGDYQQSTTLIDVQFSYANKSIISGIGIDQIPLDEWNLYPISDSYTNYKVYVMKLSIKNPDTSISGFNANISFSIRRSDYNDTWT